MGLACDCHLSPEGRTLTTETGVASPVPGAKSAQCPQWLPPTALLLTPGKSLWCEPPMRGKDLQPQQPPCPPVLCGVFPLEQTSSEEVLWLRQEAEFTCRVCLQNSISSISIPRVVHT